MSVIRQLSLFGAQAAAPVPADLAGLLLAGATTSRTSSPATAGRTSSPATAGRTSSPATASRTSSPATASRTSSPATASQTDGPATASANEGPAGVMESPAGVMESPAGANESPAGVMEGPAGVMESLTGEIEGSKARPTVTRGATAQLSLVVDHPWRGSVLVMECARRGLAATCVSTVEHGIAVRTAHSPLLLGLVGAWTDGARCRPPRDLLLDGWLLRLWVEARGRYERPGAYLLGVGSGEDADRERIGAALAAVGLSAQLLSSRGGRGYSYRIVGKKRLDRLAEMVGDPPKRAPVDIWPS